MDRQTALHRVRSLGSCQVLREPPQSSRYEPPRRLSWTEAPISVVLLSFGLSALTWAAVCLLAYGLG
jgi:hypothetical protein